MSKIQNVDIMLDSAARENGDKNFLEMMYKRKTIIMTKENHTVNWEREGEKQRESNPCRPGESRRSFETLALAVLIKTQDRAGAQLTQVLCSFFFVFLITIPRVVTAVAMGCPSAHQPGVLQTIENFLSFFLFPSAILVTNS